MSKLLKSSLVLKNSEGEWKICGFSKSIRGYHVYVYIIPDNIADGIKVKRCPIDTVGLNDIEVAAWRDGAWVLHETAAGRIVGKASGELAFVKNEEAADQSVAVVDTKQQEIEKRNTEVKKTATEDFEVQYSEMINSNYEDSYDINTLTVWLTTNNDGGTVYGVNGEIYDHDGNIHAFSYNQRTRKWDNYE